MFLKPVFTVARSSAPVTKHLQVLHLHLCAPCLGMKNKAKTKAFPSGSAASAKSSVPRFKVDTKSRQLWEAAQKLKAELQGRRPTDDVYLSSMYERKMFSLEDILSRHKQFAVPSMLDNADGVLYLKIQLNMAGKKKSKFVAAFNDVILLPHRPPVDKFRTKDVLIFCEDTAMCEKLKTAGALDAGADDLYSKLETGIYHPESYDYVICHTSFISSIAKLRNILLDKMPSKLNGCVGDDLEQLLVKFKFGLVAGAKINSVIPEEGVVSMPLGVLSLSLEQLEANTSAIINSLVASAPNRAAARDFISSVSVTCPPSDEDFLLDLESYIEKAVSSLPPLVSTKKSKKMEVEVEVEEPTDTLEAVVS